MRNLETCELHTRRICKSGSLRVSQEPTPGEREHQGTKGPWASEGFWREEGVGVGVCAGPKGRAERERETHTGKYKRWIGTACSFVLPTISSSSGEKKSEIKMEIYTVFQKLWKKIKDSHEGVLFPGVVYKEQSSCLMKSIMGTVIINSPRRILRYLYSHISPREKKNYRYIDGSFWRKYVKSGQRLQACWKSSRICLHVWLLNSILFENQTAARKVSINLLLDMAGEKKEKEKEKKACV